MQKTDAIVLALQKHTDTSSIVHLYTRSQGRMQFLVYGKRGANKRKQTGVNINLFTPLSLLEITYSDNPTKSFSIISTASLKYIPQCIPTEIKKQCIAMFMAEALEKTLRLPMQDEVLFDFIEEKIKELDLSDSVEDMPNCFLEQLSIILGYGGEPIEELANMKTRGLIEEIGAQFS